MAKKKRIYANKSGNAASAADASDLITPKAAGAAGAELPNKLRSGAASLDKRVRASVSSVKSTMSSLLPAEVERGDWTVVILALMMFLTPAVGVPNEEMLQDTLKSIVASFAAISAGLLFFWQQRNRRDGLRWHALMWLPLALMFYALGSMVWSHTYLGGVEAIRWFVFSLLLWLGQYPVSGPDRIPCRRHSLGRLCRVAWSGRGRCLRQPWPSRWSWAWRNMTA